MHSEVYKLLDWLLEDEKTSRMKLEIQVTFFLQFVTICIKIGIPFPVFGIGVFFDFAINYNESSKLKQVE